MRPRCIALVVVVLSGCATCPMQQFFSPSLAVSAAMPSVNGGQRLYVTASMDLRVEIFECGTAYKTQVDLPHFVCLNFRVRPGRQLHFETSNVLFRFPDGSSSHAALTRQDAGKYEPVTEVGPLRGELSKNAPPMQLLLSETQGWREVSARIEAPARPTNTFLVELPTVRVDDRYITFPSVTFSLVNEPVCVGGGW